MTIADSLTLLNSTKTAIREAIEDKGVTVGSIPFADYPDKIAEISGGGGGSVPLEWSQAYYDAMFAAGPGSWSRPEWRTLPSMTSTDQAFYGLHAVYPEDGNFCALTASGAYTVDWGDGTTTNHTSGSQVNYIFDYNSTALVGTDSPVTFTASTSTVNRTAHGFANGKTVTFWNIASTTGIVNGQVYYVINATANTFQVLTTLGGSAITLTNDGTASLTRYKQAIVTVTPQAGQTLTALSLDVKHSQTGTQLYSAGWLDILVGSPNFSTTGLVIGQSSSTETVRKNSIERVRIVNLGSTNTLESRFRNLRELVVVELPSTQSVTNMSSMFLSCSSLQTVPLFNTQSVTNMTNMFASCYSLQTVPLFNTQSVTNMNSMFNGCVSLQTVPLFNTQSVTSIGGMFASCYSLQTVPLFNTQSVTSMTNMFASCSSLQTVPLFNTQSVTNMSSMFNGCSSLQTVPLFNTQSVTSMSGMFASCSSLQTVPLFNTQSVTSMTSMFASCSSLQTVPLFNTQSVTNMTNMFASCYSLQNVPALVTTAVTSSSTFGTMFQSCNSLARIEAKDFRFTFSVSNCKLSAAALNEIYTNLPTVTGQTITVTGNYGTTDDGPSIATAKGWTVTG